MTQHLSRRARLSWLLAVSLLPFAAGCGSEAPKRDGGGEGETESAGSDRGITAKATWKPEAGGDEAFVTAVAWWGDHLFVGTRKGLKILELQVADAGGLTFLDTTPSQETYMKPHRVLFDEVVQIRSTDKALYICTSSGYAEYDGRNFTSEDIGKVTDMMNYEGTLWAGRTNGVQRKVGEDWHSQQMSFLDLNKNSAHQIHAFAMDGKGRLWIGSAFGIYYYDRQLPHKWGPHLRGDYQNMVDNTVINERGNTPLAGNLINHIAYDAKKDRLLVASNAGLSIFNGKDHWEFITKKDGENETVESIVREGADSWEVIQPDHEILSSEGDQVHRVVKRGNVPMPSPEFTSVAPVGKWIFVGTGAGLGRIDETKYKQDAEGGVGLFTTDDGLPSDSVTSLAYSGHKGLLFVGTEAGLVAMGPLPSNDDDTNAPGAAKHENKPSPDDSGK